MKTSHTLIGILVSLILGGAMLWVGSQGSLMHNGMALFALCGAIGFILHWAVFLPSFAFQTEHYFDLTGSTLLYQHSDCGGLSESGNGSAGSDYLRHDCYLGSTPGIVFILANQKRRPRQTL